MIQAYRHGDLCLVKLDKLPKELKVSKTNILMQNGSGGNPHSFQGGSFYPVKKEEFVIGYLKAKNTILFHVEHGEGKRGLKSAKIKDGIYEVRGQVEYTHNGMKEVID